MPVSLNAVLSTARAALTTHQGAMQVVADNIANAATEGYTRKRAELVAGTPQIQPDGIFGTGVLLRDVTQARDHYLDASHRNSISSQFQHAARFDYLGQVESVFGEPGENGLSTSFDAFWSAWSDLANDPLNQGARSLLRERGNQLAAHFNRLADTIAGMRDSAGQRLTATIEQANQLSAEIAGLNEQIVAGEAGGLQAGALRDARDLAVDRLAAIANIQVTERPNGSIAVALDGINVVDGVDHVDLHASPSGGVWQIATTTGAPAAPAGGSAGGYLSLLNGELRTLQTDLDTLAAETVTRVNAVHRQGMNAAGATNVDFFDPAQTTAGNLALSAAVNADARAIAAGTPVLVDGVPSYGAGRNDVARAMAALRHPDQGNSLGEAYDRLVTGLGVAVRTAADARDAHETLSQQSAALRDSIMGVSTDEELVELIQLQTAYSAAARVITVADEMMRTLVDIKR